MATEVRREGSALSRIEELLGEDGRALLEFDSPKISRDILHTPGPDFIDRVWADSDRSPQVLRSLQSLYDHGRLAGTGYLSILPVDQSIEHSAGASFAPNPIYFDPENIVKLAIEGGCNAVASTLGVLGAVSRKYAHKIPFLCKLNHNEFLTYPNKFDQMKFGKTSSKVYSDLTPGDHPIEMTRYQIANCYNGRAPLINSGGESKGASDMAEAVRTAVINKRAGGMGLISGRKAFQRPMKEGAALLQAIQDVYLDKSVTIA